MSDPLIPFVLGWSVALLSVALGYALSRRAPRRR